MVEKSVDQVCRLHPLESYCHFSVDWLTDWKIKYDIAIPRAMLLAWTKCLAWFSWESFVYIQVGSSAVIAVYVQALPGPGSPQVLQLKPAIFTLTCFCIDLLIFKDFCLGI